MEYNMDDAISFIHQYKWIFNFRMPQLFSENIVDKIELQVESVEKSFYDSCDKLGFNHNSIPTVSAVQSPLPKGLTPKKHHEITNFTAFITTTIQQTQAECIVDIGCGLGHLAKSLQQNCGVKLIGIDSQKQLCAKASQSCSNGDLSFYSMVIEYSNECLAQLEQIIADSQCAIVGLIGLHCCGDLHANLLKIFQRSGKLRFCVIVGCCYHKMNSSQNGRIGNFPMSSRLKAFANDEFIDVMREFGLRLAAEQTYQMWMKRTQTAQMEHFNRVYRRCLLELVSKTKGINVKHPSGSHNSLSGYIEAGLKASNPDGTGSDNSQVTEFMLKADEEFRPHSHLLQQLTELQFRLQSVLERLILQDQLSYLNEQLPHANNCLQQLFDPSLSPRCVALMSVKPI